VNVTLVTFCGMLDLRAAVLGRMGGLSPSKSVCSILPIARDYRDRVSIIALCHIRLPALLFSGRGFLFGSAASTRPVFFL
jgi:hypothetical protein